MITAELLQDLKVEYGAIGSRDIDVARWNAKLDRAINALHEGRVRPLSEWHEDHGFVVWWAFPVKEPSWIGTPNDSDWPGYHTHWTPHPAIPKEPK